MGLRQAFEIKSSRLALSPGPNRPQFHSVQSDPENVVQILFPELPIREGSAIVLCAENHASTLANASTYPLTAPPVAPLAIYFWIKKPITIIGTMVSVAAALLFPQSTEIEPTNFEIPTGNVYVSRFVSCKAKRSSFQDN